MSRVLVVASHPDDELLGVGGTILRHREFGDTIRVHLEHVGELRDAGARLGAAVRIADRIGYKLTFGTSRQLDYRVPDLGAAVREFKPEIVYTHHAGDINRDHRHLYEAVAVACRPFAADVRSLRTFDTASSTEWGAGRFNPNLFVDIGHLLDGKLELLAEYAGELRDAPHPRSLDGLRTRARYWGGLAGYWAAEPFHVVRERW